MLDNANIFSLARILDSSSNGILSNIYKLSSKDQIGLKPLRRSAFVIYYGRFINLLKNYYLTLQNFILTFHLYDLNITQTIIRMKYENKILKC